MTKSLIDIVSKQTTLSSYLIRSLYLLGLLCHIPFVFFGAKLSFLVIIEELLNRTLTSNIDKIMTEHTLQKEKRRLDREIRGDPLEVTMS